MAPSISSERHQFASRRLLRYNLTMTMGRMRAIMLGTAMLLVATAGCTREPAGSALRFVDNQGHVTTLSSLKNKGAILVFWRSDCAPCVLELRNLNALQAAAGAGRLIAINLEAEEAARSFLHREGISPANNWRALDTPASVLTALNGEPPRLPLAVALNDRGSICARHTGLLGTDRVKEWARRCS